MHAILLAAGVGKRLGKGENHPPKCLLRFDGKTLLERHLEILRACGIWQVVVGVGYQADRVQSEIDRLGFGGFTSTILNPDFEQGSILTLWTLREAVTRSGDILLMDADVLYDHRLLRRLKDSRNPNCFLMDRNFESGDEPVKLCVRDGTLVEFRKKVEVPYDLWGESVGFFKLTEITARQLVTAIKKFIDAGENEECYEEALRKILLSSTPFGYEDVTGLPWIEIDFPEDVQRAQLQILPKLITD